MYVSLGQGKEAWYLDKYVHLHWICDAIVICNVSIIVKDLEHSSKRMSTRPLTETLMHVISSWHMHTTPPMIITHSLHHYCNVIILAVYCATHLYVILVLQNINLSIVILSFFFAIYQFLIQALLQFVFLLQRDYLWNITMEVNEWIILKSKKIIK